MPSLWAGGAGGCVGWEGCSRPPAPSVGQQGSGMNQVGQRFDVESGGEGQDTVLALSHAASAHPAGTGEAGGKA